MNSAKSRCPLGTAVRGWLALGALLFLTASFAADSRLRFREDVWLDIGIEAIKPVERAAEHLTFRATAPEGSRKALSPSTLKTMGGVLFLELARPLKDGTANCPRIGYDVSRPNGNRFFAVLDKKGLAYGDIFDWEIVPTVGLVDSGLDGVLTYMGFVADYHQAFSNNLAGANFFFLDNARSIRNFEEIHRSLGANVPGYPQTKATQKAKQVTAEISSWMGAAHLLFTDEGVNYTFFRQGAKFVIRGTPYWMAVKSDRDGANGKESGRLTDTARTLESNPVVYGSAYRVARYTAFLRHMKKNCASEWSSFTAELGANRGSIDQVQIELMPHRVRR